MGSDDQVRALVHEDLGCGGRFSDPVVGVPAAGVVVVHLEVDVVCACLRFEHPDACEFGHGEHSGGNGAVVGGGGGATDHVRRSDLRFEHRDGCQRRSGGGCRVAGSED